jgi:hypothetical protein
VFTVVTKKGRLLGGRESLKDSMFRNRSGFDGFLALGDNAVGSLSDHPFQKQSQM